MIRALIVEDTPWARKGIRLFLEVEKDIEIVGEACDGLDAVTQMAALRPDLVFLDVQMPGLNGFEVLERSQTALPRAIIFITAYADYAMRAFEHRAVSYLLKPIDPDRFREAVHRVRLLLTHPAADGAGDEQLDSGRPLTRLLVRQGERYLFLRTDEIDWIEATGDYTSLHTGRGSWLLRMSISELAERLDARQFARIHRGTVVNLDRVREILPRSHGDCDVVLHDGQQLRLSRSYRDRLFSLGL